MFVYIIGSAIKNEMNVESSFDVSHIRASTINDATGTDFTVIINGHSKSSTIEKRAAIRARINPKIKPSEKPRMILIKLLDIARKNPSSDHMVNSLHITLIGVGKRKSVFTIIADACHTVSDISTANVRLTPLFFNIIEAVTR